MNTRTGRTAIVTGASSGIGRATVFGLVRAGATVYITSRKADICERTALELGAFGQCYALPGELTAPEDVAALPLGRAQIITPGHGQGR
jgi:NAD(P)-dependent dehydrogenase (short-subunit alcohol dehydrogenase family)